MSALRVLTVDDEMLALRRLKLLLQAMPYVEHIGEASSCAEALAAMSNDERWEMGLRARQYIEEHHDFAMLARRFERVLKSALASSEEVQNEARVLT